MHAVFTSKSVARLFAIRKLVLAILCPDWTSRRIAHFFLNCALAAGHSRVVFIVTACLAQGRSSRVFFDRIKPVFESKAAVDVLDTCLMLTKVLTS